MSSPSISDDEKKDYISTGVVPVDSEKVAFGDEALGLAGQVRHEFSPEESEIVRKKVDRRVIPILAAVYFSQFYDKNSLNYASVMGLPITGQNYSLIALAFYIGFLCFEIPTSIVARKFPLAKYLGVQMFFWSICLILQAASPAFASFFVLRFFQGAFESCVTPILLIMIASWYPRKEQAKRIGAFYVCNGLTSIFGGLMAWAITLYSGKAIATWRIIFLFQGGLGSSFEPPNFRHPQLIRILFRFEAFLVALVVLLYLPDSPATATFLTPREQIVAIERVRTNQTGTLNRVFKRSQVVEALKDSRTWLMCLLVCAFSIPNGGISNFQSILIKSFGFTSQQSLLLNMPGGFVGAVTTILVCYWSDRTTGRTIPVLGAIVPTIIGVAILVGTSTSIGKYQGASLLGIYLAQTYGSGLAIMYSWLSSNIAGSSKKSIVNGMVMASFALGNIVGTELFQAKDAPQYLPAKVAILVIFSLLVPLILYIRWLSISLNKKKALTLAELARENGWDEEAIRREADKAAFLDMTDRENPFFVYLA